MAATILAFHNILRWLVVLLAVIALLRALKGINGGTDYTTGARRAVTTPDPHG